MDKTKNTLYEMRHNGTAIFAAEYGQRVIRENRYTQIKHFQKSNPPKSNSKKKET